MLSLGQKIRQRRMDKGLTQGQLAQGLVSASAISQIESDKINPSYKLLVQIAERLEVPLDEFLSDREDYLEQTTSHKLAKTFLMAKEYTNALPILEQLLSSAAGNVDEGEVMLDLATCYLELKHYSKAQELFEKVMYLTLKGDDMISYLTSLHRLGKLFYEQQNISLAQHYWQKAYDLLQEVENVDVFLQAEITTNLAITYNHFGNYDQSTELFRRSLALLQNTTNLHHLATNYLGLGKSSYGRKEFKLAEEYCREASTLFKNLDNICKSIEVKVNFGIIQGENGEVDKALDTLYECLQEFEQYGFEAHSSNAHSELAKLLVLQSRFADAKSHIDRAFATSQPNTLFHGQAFYVRSLWNSSQQQYDAAIADAREAMNIFLAVDALQEYNNSALLLSDIYKTLGDYRSSTFILEESQHSIQNFLKEKGFIL